MAGTGDASLRQQFSLLQEQQQRKLARRKKNNDKVSSELVNNSTSFGVSDNLDLKLSCPPSSQGYISEELVDHLNEQIRELKDENGRVYRLLSERDFELRQAKKKREDEKAAFASAGGPITNETAATKIVELSKKLRDMRAELESEKTKSAQLTRRCHEMQQQICNSDNKSASAVSLRSSLDMKPEDPGEIKTLLDKLKQMESKMIDCRNQNSSLKQEIRITQKALVQEVGENVNVQSCLSNTGSWRGRSQQILALQQKNEDLRRDLEKAQGMDGEPERRHTATDKHREQLRRMEREKKEAQEKQATDKSALEEENYAIKHKLDAAKTRNAVLSSELKSQKKQIQQLLQKNQHDDELVEALMKQQTQLQQQLHASAEAQQNATLDKQAKLNELSAKQQQETNIVEQLKTIVADKETKVKVLENEIQQLKLAHLQRVQAQSMSKLFPQKPGSALSMVSNGNQPSPSGYDPVQLDYTINSVSPPESRLNNVLMSQYPVVDITVPSTAPRSAAASRASDCRTPSRAELLHSRAVSSAGGESKLMADLQYQCQEYRTITQVAEVERDKLMDLTKVLQKRLEEASIGLQESQSDLLQQRRRNALLEKQLGKASLATARQGNTSARKKPMGKTNIGNVPPPGDDEDHCPLSSEELLTKLEIQQDENAALKAALTSTLAAKQEDLTMYSDTIEETKKVFLQALRQYKNNVHGT